MQNRYTGDIGDYAKYALLRALSPGLRLGLAWYLHPDESHNNDGRHTDYLRQPDKWKALDPELFEILNDLINRDKRSVEAIEGAGIFSPNTMFASEPLHFPTSSRTGRVAWRRAWFQRTLDAVRGCELVFADPDNGLCADERLAGGEKPIMKKISLAEAVELARDRTAIIYHHNTRSKGGHYREVRLWQKHLGSKLALRWRSYSPRTFFILNASSAVEARLHDFADRCARIGCAEVVKADDPESLRAAA